MEKTLTPILIGKENNETTHRSRHPRSIDKNKAKSMRTAVREPLYYVIDFFYFLSNTCKYL